MATEPHFDGCEIVKKLRSGPATDWYLGKQRSLGRPVVIKALSPNVLPESPFAGPLIREAKLLAQLQHKNIVQLYEFAQRPNSMWLVLEHVDGLSLEELLADSAQLSVPAALAITMQLVSTLGYVHSMGIVHRDVHPKNIWISREGEVKLSNFFLAAEHSTPSPPELLEADSGFESPSYMSPEQLLSEAPDPRSDLFSIGVILYEMLAGRRPFDASDTRTTTQRIRHEPPPNITQFAPHTLPSVERVVHRALQKLPADRFQDAAEMLVMLEAAWAQFGKPDAREMILDELSQRQVVTRTTVVRQPRPVAKEQGNMVLRALAVYSGCFVLLAAGGVLIQGLSEKHVSVEPTQRGVLELAPADAGYLSCIVYPWAHVYVDGQRVATTPFATPIPLQPGTHYVKLEHPNAPAEQRVIKIAPGQRLSLDVRMQLPGPVPEPEPDLMAPPRDAGTPTP